MQCPLHVKVTLLNLLSVLEIIFPVQGVQFTFFPGFQLTVSRTAFRMMSECYTKPDLPDSPGSFQSAQILLYFLHEVSLFHALIRGTCPALHLLPPLICLSLSFLFFCSFTRNPHCLMTEVSNIIFMLIICLSHRCLLSLPWDYGPVALLFDVSKCL